jgi:predicted permease
LKHFNISLALEFYNAFHLLKEIILFFSKTNLKFMEEREREKEIEMKKKYEKKSENALCTQIYQ